MHQTQKIKSRILLTSIISCTKIHLIWLYQNYLKHGCKENAYRKQMWEEQLLELAIRCPKTWNAISHLHSLLFWSTALAEAGQRVQSGVVRLLLHTVWLLHQGPPQPGAARPLSSPPAEWRTKETPAASARTGRGWGWTEPPRTVPRQGMPLQPRSVLL